MGFRDSILAGTALVRQAIKSPNYIAGLMGWSINRDGSAEFNDVVIRGGTTVSGDFLAYSGTPASGNLILSISAMGGTDPFGNVYSPGIVSYGTRSGDPYYSSVRNSRIELGVPGQVNPGNLQYFDLAANTFELIMSSGRGPTAFFNEAVINLTSGSAAGTTDDSIDLRSNHINANGEFHAPNIQSGRVSVPAAVTAGQWSANVLISFTGTFATVPVVTMTPNAAGPGVGTTTALQWQITSVTASGFMVRVLRGNTSATDMGWLAIST